jgi:hypothetical protein
MEAAELIRKDGAISIADTDIVIFHSTMYREQKRSEADRMIKEIATAPRRRYVTVFIDEDDGVRTPGFACGAISCDIVLKSHYNRKYRYPSNFRPWQFGLSNRIIEAVQPVEWEQRKNSIIVNFRPEHQLRKYVNSLLLPEIERCMTIDSRVDKIDVEKLEGYERLMYYQSRGRHYQPYYERLSASKICACYGGVFALSWWNYNRYTARLAREINNVLHISKWDRVRQWDSWRLWEAWAAGCCVVHIDLEKYGCELPVMPENGVDYVGLDIESLNTLKINGLAGGGGVNSLFLDDDRLREIASKGRRFALENYSPKAVAERLLKYIGKT